MRDVGRLLSLRRRGGGGVTHMKIRHPHGGVGAAALVIAGCSEDTQDAVEDDLDTAATEVGEAVGEATNDAGEALARNIATQQGEEQFNNAGHELDGPLTCEATVRDDVAQIDITCTGTTQA